jgi:PAS domain S-box-containing protein
MSTPETPTPSTLATKASPETSTNRGTDSIQQAVTRRMEQLTSRVLSRFALFTGTLLLGVSLLQMALEGPGDGFAWQRALLGLVFLGGWACSDWLGQRRGQEWLAVGLLVAANAGLTAHAVLTGLGVHSFALAGQALAVGVAGVLVSMRAAVVVATFTVVASVVLWWVETTQWAPLGAVHADADQRMVGMVLLVGASLAASYHLARVVTASLRAALVQERKLAQLVRLGSDWIWRINEYGELVELSRSFEAHSGRKRKEFFRLGQPGGPKRVRNEAEAQLRQRLRAKQPFRDVETTFRCADGFELHTRSSGEPVFHRDGSAAGWRGVGRNITAEVQARREATDHRALVDRLFHASQDALVVANVRTGATLLANEGFAKLCGRPLAEVLGRSALELGLWTDPQTPAALGEAMKVTGTLQDHPSQMQTADGPRDVLISGTVFDWQGEPVAIHTVRDISGVGRDRRELMAILQHAGIGIAMVRNRRYERVNPAYERMFGRAVGSLGGASTRVMFDSDEEYAAFISKSDARQASGGVIDVERRIVRPDGSPVVVRMRAYAVDPKDPRHGGTIWVTEDITAARQAERELVLAQQQADAANRAKSAFLATMSHEIRTPLHGVLGLAALIEHEQDAFKRDQYLARLVESAQALGGLVSDVLDLSKIEAGRLKIEHRPFDLHDLLGRVFEGNALIGRERGLDMQLLVPPDVPHQVVGDAVRVRQILVNLLNNALKFTERGRITLSVSVPHAPQRLLFTVADTGPGIPLDAQGELFQRFTQADTSSTRRYGGTGLGLSICRELALAMGGEVGVDSAPGRGSRFWVALPLPTVLGAVPPAVRPLGQQPLHGLRALLAEDNPVNTLILQAQLQQLGAQVRTAANGLQAVEMALAQLPALDVVLMDLHMPELDGWSAAERLRQDPGRPTCPSSP